MQLFVYILSLISVLTQFEIYRKFRTIYFDGFEEFFDSFIKTYLTLSLPKIEVNKYNIKTFENVHKYAGDSFYKDFNIRKRTNNIFISSKLATSKDLFISDKYNKWITNIYSRGRVHLLRANHDSILTTSKTILRDDAMLNCRINGLQK